MARKFRYAHLTRDEDITYSVEWEQYMNNVRPDPNRADRHAWKVLREKFPRLREFDGATTE